MRPARVLPVISRYAVAMLVGVGLVVAALPARGEQPTGPSAASGPAAPTPKFEFTQAGVSIKVGGVEWGADGEFACTTAVVEETTVDANNVRQYKFTRYTDAPQSSSPMSAHPGTVQKYAWGTVGIQYFPRPGRLDLAVTIENRSTGVLADWEMTLLTLRLPASPAGFKGAMVSTLDNLGIVEANCGGTRLIACCDTIYPPLHFGLGKPSGKDNLDVPLVVKGGVNVPEPGAYFIHPHGLPRIPPGKNLTLEFSLRWPGKAESEVVLADLYKRFADYYKPTHAWGDHRPIGQLILPTGGDPKKKTVANPRNWFGDPKMDINTDEGQAKFKKQMMDYADRSIKAIQDTGGQGMILWNMEGEENPQPISYIGDPRMTKVLAPEMDAVADEFFAKFRDANLRVGVCLRPTQVYYNAEKKVWAHGTGSDMPGRNEQYQLLKPADLPAWQFFPLFERMSDKIAYAQKRWGCTLFYVDTNGVNQPWGEPNEVKFAWRLLDSDVWKRLSIKHPDVLLIPELHNGDGASHIACWAFVAQYLELDYGGMWRTPKRIKAMFPDAFSCVAMKDAKGYADKRADLVEGIRGGDLLFFRGWFGDSINAKVKSAHDDAARKE